MALCELKFWSASLEKQEAACVIVPDGKGPFPVLYLLHGLTDNYTIWQRRTSIERHLEGVPLIVVMPDGGRSFYCNAPGGPRYEDHILRDVVGTIDRMFKTKRNMKARAIAGLSMGGYGATMLALRHPDMFSAACSHSGAMFFAGPASQMKPKPAVDDWIYRYGASLPAGAYDCFKLAASAKKRGRIPALRFDCGHDDLLLSCNRAFHDHLQKLGIRHIYEEYPGGHEWSYWDEHVRQTIDFVMKNVKG